MARLYVQRRERCLMRSEFLSMPYTAADASCRVYNGSYEFINRGFNNLPLCDAAEQFIRRCFLLRIIIFYILFAFIENPVPFSLYKKLYIGILVL